MTIKGFECCFYRRKQEWVMAQKTIVFAMPSFCIKSLPILLDWAETQIY